MSGQIIPLCSINDAPAHDPAEVVVARLGVGQQLRAARLGKGLTVVDIAKALKLSPHQVDALEADDWARLPCNTIIRGFVRNYGRLLGLNPDALMAMLDTVQMPPMAELAMPAGTNVPVPQEGGVERRDYVRVFSGVSVLALAVAAYLFLPQELWQQAVVAVQTLTQSRQEAPGEVAPPVASAQAPDLLSPPAQPAQVAGETPTVAALPAVAVSAAAAPPPVASRLNFSFARPAWVEVRDRSGEIVFSQLSPAGSQREIEGQPPFALVIGNAGHVTLNYKGKAVDLSKRSRDDVARVTVE